MLVGETPVSYSYLLRIFVPPPVIAYFLVELCRQISPPVSQGGSS